MSIIVNQLYYKPLFNSLLCVRAHISNTCKLTRSFQRSLTHNVVSNQEFSLIDSTLVNLKNDIARRLLERLVLRSVSFHPSKLSGISKFIKDVKRQNNKHLVLLRHGNFYQTVGIDAIMFVEHANLKPIGNTSHVEIALSELQEVLGKLTDKGFSIAIYEQINHSMISCDYKPESYYLSHVVTNDAPIYKFDDNYAKNDHVSISSVVITIGYGKYGYSISVIDPHAKNVKLYERLSLIEAISLTKSVNTSVIILQNNSAEILKLSKKISTVVHCQTIEGTYDDENFHIAAYHSIARRLGIAVDFNISKMNFENTVCPLNRNCIRVLELDNETYGLHHMVLPKDSPSYMTRYMRLLMLRPPQLNMCNNLRYINSTLATLNVAMIRVKPVSIASINNKITASSVDPQFYKNVYDNLKSFIYYVDTLPMKLIKSILSIVEIDLNLVCKLSTIIKDVNACINSINSIIKIEHSESSIPYTGVKSIDKLFNDMESYRDICHEYLIQKEQYKVDSAAIEFLESLSKYYIGHEISWCDCNDNVREKRRFISNSLESCIDYKHRIIYPNIKTTVDLVFIDKLTDCIDHTKLYTIDVVDDDKFSKCYVNSNVINSLINYKSICRVAQTKVNDLISGISKTLVPHLQCIEIVTQFLIILQTLVAHVGLATSNGWSIPCTHKKLVLNDLKPLGEDPISLGVKLDGLTILTGDHNSGKSRLLLSILASTFLSNIGLYSPISRNSQVPFIKRYFFYSGDDSIHSFVDQIKDIENIIQHLTDDSIVLLDNPGMGCDIRTGIGLICIMCDILVKCKCLSVISTHLQEYLLSVLKNQNSLFYKKLVSVNGHINLEDGIFINDFKLNHLHKLINDTGVNAYDGLFRNIAQSTDSSSMNFINNLPNYIKEEVKIIMNCIKDLDICVNEGDAIYLFPNSLPPPRYNYVPVLYVLLIPTKILMENAPNYAIYVGESGNITYRLMKHRSKGSKDVEQYLTETYIQHDADLTNYLRQKFGKDGRKHESLRWDESHAIIVKTESRKTAKLCERKLINMIYKHPENFLLVSHRDGYNVDLPYLD